MAKQIVIEFALPVVVFGTDCLCCNADTEGRTQDHTPVVDVNLVSLATARTVPMPVCADCRAHALGGIGAVVLQVLLLLAGAGVLAIALVLGQEREMPWNAVAGGATMLAVAVAWIIARSRGTRRDRAAGHHPRAMFVTAHGRRLFYTTNPTLADALIADNPGAKRLGKSKVPVAKGSGTSLSS